MNEKFEVLTVRDVRFKDKQSDREISGMQLWLLGETTDPAWRGYEVLKLWISSDSPMAADVYQLRRCDHVQVSFGRNGKPRMITLL